MILTGALSLPRIESCYRRDKMLIYNYRAAPLRLLITTVMANSLRFNVIRNNARVHHVCIYFYLDNIYNFERGIKGEKM